MLCRWEKKNCRRLSMCLEGWWSCSKVTKELTHVCGGDAEGARTAPEAGG